jgi:hypothetical protein
MRCGSNVCVCECVCVGGGGSLSGGAIYIETPGHTAFAGQGVLGPESGFGGSGNALASSITLVLVRVTPEPCKNSTEWIPYYGVQATNPAMTRGEQTHKRHVSHSGSSIAGLIAGLLRHIASTWRLQKDGQRIKGCTARSVGRMSRTHHDGHFLRCSNCRCSQRNWMPRWLTYQEQHAWRREKITDSRTTARRADCNATC